MSEKLRIGVFGGYRGSSMIQVLLHHPDAELVAVCDKYQPLLDKAKAEAEAAGSWPPQAVRARVRDSARAAQSSFFKVFIVVSPLSFQKVDLFHLPGHAAACRSLRQGRHRRKKCNMANALLCRKV